MQERYSLSLLACICLKKPWSGEVDFCVLSLCISTVVMIEGCWEPLAGLWVVSILVILMAVSVKKNIVITKINFKWFLMSSTGQCGATEVTATTPAWVVFTVVLVFDPLSFPWRAGLRRLEVWRDWSYSSRSTRSASWWWHEQTCCSSFLWQMARCGERCWVQSVFYYHRWLRKCES